MSIQPDESPINLYIVEERTYEPSFDGTPPNYTVQMIGPFTWEELEVFCANIPESETVRYSPWVLTDFPI